MGSVSSHEHRPISNGYHDAPEEVVCYACNKQIFKGCSSSVYSCTEGCGTISLHKTCAELPPTFTHHAHPHHILKLKQRPTHLRGYFNCDVCKVKWKWSTYHCSECSNSYDVCLSCVIFELLSSDDRHFHHPGHDKHPLTLVQRPAWFECDACETGAFDLSYVCTKCPFWMHQRCAFAPTTLEYKFHDNHPLILAYSLPEQYRSFIQFCKICSEELNILRWLYFCADCRFFAHIKCVMSTQIMEEPPLTLNYRSNENENEADLGKTNLVNLPPPDKSSVDLIMQQFVRAISLTDDNTPAPDHINHWAHNDHPLKLFDQLIEKKNTTTKSFDTKGDEMLKCDGCGRPISSGHLFYGCVICNYFLHKFCAEIPLEIEPQIYPGHRFIRRRKTKPYELVRCIGCGYYFNGIHLNCESVNLCIGCISLPGTIKHEGHKHHLTSKLGINDAMSRCRACGDLIWQQTQYRCEVCKLCIHATCVVRPGTVRHRWDPHPLHLIYAAVMVMDHPHEFDCEICSKDIDTNTWFYHCALCDLSLHLCCFDRFDAISTEYSHVMFGANNIKVENSHPHNLTFTLNKTKRRGLCSGCTDPSLDRPVLECAPCSFVLCWRCVKRASV